MYKILNNHTAPNLKGLFRRNDITQINYNLRNSNTDVALPKPKNEFRKKSFGYSGAILWNNLPQELKLMESINSFKSGVKKHIL